MSDPRDLHRENPNRPGVVEANRGMPWVWIAGAVAVVLLIMIFAFGTGNEQTADAPGTKTETTGTAPRTSPPAGQTNAPVEAPTAKPEQTAPQK